MPPWQIWNLPTDQRHSVIYSLLETVIHASQHDRHIASLQVHQNGAWRLGTLTWIWWFLAAYVTEMKSKLDRNLKMAHHSSPQKLIKVRANSWDSSRFETKIGCGVKHWTYLSLRTMQQLFVVIRNWSGMFACRSD